MLKYYSPKIVFNLFLFEDTNGIITKKIIELKMIRKIRTIFSNVENPDQRLKTELALRDSSNRFKVKQLT